jgi:hypothetical protein
MIRPIGHLHYFRVNPTELLARSSLALQHIENYDLLEPLGRQARAFLSTARALALQHIENYDLLDVGAA